jgi:ubiquinone/menaquinone biosynthesis C-methylase UbiE
MLVSNIKRIFKKGHPVEKNSSEAYDMWSTAYDNQPGNLMLDLDELIFKSSFDAVDVKNKSVADIGCGTGRHWQKILSKNPKKLTGFDVSEGMLKKLKEKFVSAEVFQIKDDTLPNIPDASFDIVISTLTVAHIKDLEPALNAWCRILKNNAELIITDFHPQLLAHGGKRTFNHNSQQVSITNFVHPLNKIKDLFYQNGFTLVAEKEKIINEAVKKYYADQNALHVYEKFKDLPVIYGLHLKRTDGNK